MIVPYAAPDQRQVRLSNVPEEYTRETLEDLHEAVKLSPQSLLDVNFQPPNTNSASATCSVLLRYVDRDSARKAVSALNRHPVMMSTGDLKKLSAHLDEGNDEPALPSAIISNVPLAYDEAVLRGVHLQSDLDDKQVLSFKFFPSQDGETTSCMVWYSDVEAAKHAVIALNGRQVLTRSGAKTALTAKLPKSHSHSSRGVPADIKRKNRSRSKGEAPGPSKSCSKSRSRVAKRSASRRFSRNARLSSSKLSRSRSNRRRSRSRRSKIRRRSPSLGRRSRSLARRVDRRSGSRRRSRSNWANPNRRRRSNSRNLRRSSSRNIRRSRSQKPNLRRKRSSSSGRRRSRSKTSPKAIALQRIEDIDKLRKDFLMKSMLDASVVKTLRDLPYAVQKQVIKEGPLVGDDQSATLMRRIKRVLLEMDEKQNVPKASTGKNYSAVSDSSIKKFIDDSAMDQYTAKLFQDLSADAKQHVMNEGALRAERSADRAEELMTRVRLHLKNSLETSGRRKGTSDNHADSHIAATDKQIMDRGPLAGAQDPSAVLSGRSRDSAQHKPKPAHPSYLDISRFVIDTRIDILTERAFRNQPMEVQAQVIARGTLTGIRPPNEEVRARIKEAQQSIFAQAASSSEQSGQNDMDPNEVEAMLSLLPQDKKERQEILAQQPSPMREEVERGLAAKELELAMASADLAALVKAVADACKFGVANAKVAAAEGMVNSLRAQAAAKTAAAAGSDAQPQMPRPQAPDAQLESARPVASSTIEAQTSSSDVAGKLPVPELQGIRAPVPKSSMHKGSGRVAPVSKSSSTLLKSCVPKSNIVPKMPVAKGSSIVANVPIAAASKLASQDQPDEDEGEPCNAHSTPAPASPSKLPQQEPDPAGFQPPLQPHMEAHAGAGESSDADVGAVQQGNAARDSAAAHGLWSDPEASEKDASLHAARGVWSDSQDPETDRNMPERGGVWDDPEEAPEEDTPAKQAYNIWSKSEASEKVSVEVKSTAANPLPFWASRYCKSPTPAEHGQSSNDQSEAKGGRNGAPWHSDTDTDTVKLLRDMLGTSQSGNQHHPQDLRGQAFDSRQLVDRQANPQNLDTNAHREGLSMESPIDDKIRGAPWRGKDHLRSQPQGLHDNASREDEDSNKDQEGSRRSHFLSMSVRELKATARNCGIPDAAIEYANDEDDAKEALTTLILTHEATTTVLFLPIELRGITILKEQSDGVFLVDTSDLQKVIGRSGIAYRRSKNVEDTAPTGVYHGETIRGLDEGDGWIKVEAIEATEYEITIERDSAGLVGFTCDLRTLRIKTIMQGRADVQQMKPGDQILAVNGNNVATGDDYLAHAKNVAKLQLTMLREERYDATSREDNDLNTRDLESGSNSPVPIAASEYEVTIERDSAGLLGFTCDLRTLRIKNMMQGRADVQKMKHGDKVIAVNGIKVVTGDDYIASAKNVAKLQLTMLREAPPKTKLVPVAKWAPKKRYTVDAPDNDQIEENMRARYTENVPDDQPEENGIAPDEVRRGNAMSSHDQRSSSTRLQRVGGRAAPRAPSEVPPADVLSTTPAVPAKMPPSTLDISTMIVAGGKPDWEAKAFSIFEEHGFVIVKGALKAPQCEAVMQECARVASKMPKPLPRYQLGDVSSKGSMLHFPNFAKHLICGAGAKLRPLLNKIFDCEGGVHPRFSCITGSGRVVAANVASYEDLDADIRVPSQLNVSLPPPLVAVDCCLEALTDSSGAPRIVPGTQLHAEEVPDPEPSEWLRSRLSPIPQGAAIVRDARALLGGTPNLSDQSVFLPCIEYASEELLSANVKDKRFPLLKSLPDKIFEKMPPQIQELCVDIIGETE